MTYLDNGTIRIGVDLNLGGVITYFAGSKSPQNIINSHDLGRQIQQSYYSGPAPYGHPVASWPGWPWNPIGTGDVFGHPAKVLRWSNNDKEIYVKSIPMQWALNNVPGNCWFESWITLQGNTALIRCRPCIPLESSTGFFLMMEITPLRIGRFISSKTAGRLG